MESFDYRIEKNNKPTIIFKIGNKFFEFNWSEFERELRKRLGVGGQLNLSKGDEAKDEEGGVEEGIERIISGAKKGLENAKVQLGVKYKEEPMDGAEKLAEELCGFLDECERIGARRVIFTAENLEQFITEVSFLSFSE